MADREQMSRERYSQTQEMLLSLAGMAHQLGSALDLDAFIAEAGRAHAIGPILDPTAYLAGSDRMQAIADLAGATRRYLKAIEDCRGVIEKTEGRAERYRQHARTVQEVLGDG